MCARLLQCAPALRYGDGMKPVPRWFVAVCWVLAVLFSLSVGLQANDPDPLRWMAMYGAAAVSVALLPWHREAALGAIAVGVVSAIWGAYLGRQVLGVVSPGDLFGKMTEKGGAVEVGREAAGLAIISVSMFGLAAYRALRD